MERGACIYTNTPDDVIGLENYHVGEGMDYGGIYISNEKEDN